MAQRRCAGAFERAPRLGLRRGEPLRSATGPPVDLVAPAAGVANPAPRLLSRRAGRPPGRPQQPRRPALRQLPLSTRRLAALRSGDRWPAFRSAAAGRRPPENPPQSPLPERDPRGAQPQSLGCRGGGAVRGDPAIERRFSLAQLPQRQRLLSSHHQIWCPDQAPLCRKEHLIPRRRGATVRAARGCWLLQRVLSNV